MSDRPVLPPTDALGLADDNAPHPEGTVLHGRYRLTDIVGRGGMGNVYRAEDLRLPGRLCAIKGVPPDPHLSPELRRQAHQQFLQEASILAQLDHPNLPKVSDFFSSDNRDYLVMDFVPGNDLRELLQASHERGEMLAEVTVLGWATQIIDALSYLHRQSPPVVHRDIKPSNIKLTPDDRIKLVDFGLVKLLAPDDARTITVVQGRGTALYTPLEQYGGDSGHTDVRTDIYALGATFYHLLSDFPPPDAKSRFLNPRALRPLRGLNRAFRHVWPRPSSGPWRCTPTTGRNLSSSSPTLSLGGRRERAPPAAIASRSTTRKPRCRPAGPGPVCGRCGDDPALGQ